MLLHAFELLILSVLDIALFDLVLDPLHAFLPLQLRLPRLLSGNFGRLLLFFLIDFVGARGPEAGVRDSAFSTGGESWAWTASNPTVTAKSTTADPRTMDRIICNCVMTILLIQRLRDARLLMALHLDEALKGLPAKSASIARTRAGDLEKNARIRSAKTDSLKAQTQRSAGGPLDDFPH